MKGGNNIGQQGYYKEETHVIKEGMQENEKTEGKRKFNMQCLRDVW